MRKYDSYKDSDINWVQEIPNHWSKNKFKFLFNEKKSTPNPSLNSGSISFGEVIYKDDESIPESTKLSYQEVLEGEFLINPLNLNYDLKSLRIGKSKINVVVSQGYIVLQLVSKDNPEYFRFLLRDFDVRHLKSLGSGVRQTISFTHLKFEELPIPPISEQKQIVSFLDTKTSQIDSLIEKTQRKIELLKEKRTSLINEVVTKGLNPNVEMKDSGVEWIGEIPSHWRTGKLYQYSEMSNGSTPSRVKPEYWENGTIPWMSSGEINKKKIREIDGRITQEGFENSSTKLLPVGTVMMGLNGQGKTKGTVGILEIETTCNQSLCGMIFNDYMYPMFSYYFLDSQYYHIRGLVGEGQREGISVSFLGRYPLVIPPLSEQNEIVSYLDEHTQLIDKTISVEERRIELLKEYRQSLISEVVTGKRKVVD